MSESLDTTGNVTAQQLYAPYGGVRYASGTLPTTKGYTGQVLILQRTAQGSKLQAPAIETMPWQLLE